MSKRDPNYVFDNWTHWDFVSEVVLDGIHYDLDEANRANNMQEYAISLTLIREFAMWRNV